MPMTKNFIASVIIGVLVLFVFAYFIFDLNGSSASSSNGTDAITIQQVTPAKPSSNSNSSGKLQMVEEKIGTGRAVKKGDTVAINYVGTLTNGKVFDASAKDGGPFTTQIGVGRVIKGWDEGIIGMKVGGERKLVIPPSLAYGSQGVGSIPPNSTLIFQVQLVGIK